MLNYQKVFGATEWGCFITGDGIPKLVERASGEAFDTGTRVTTGGYTPISSANQHI